MSAAERVGLLGQPGFVLDLRCEVRADPLVLSTARGLSDEAREAARDNWRARMVSEHASARVFAALTEQLMRAGLHRSHVLAASAMVADELAHGVLCARALTALGGEAIAEIPRDLPDVPRHEDASPLEAALRNLVSVSCCSETVAVALVAAEREQAACPELGALLQRILRDEVTHARLGWRILEHVAPALDAGARARLTRYLAVAFEHQIDFHAPFTGVAAASDDAVSHGAMDGPANFRVFVATMTDVVVPGLEARGLGAREAWQEALAVVEARPVVRRRPLPSERALRMTHAEPAPLA